MRSVVLVFSLLAVASSTAFAQTEPADGGAADGGAALEPLEQPSLPPIPEVDGGIAQISLGEAVARALAQNPELGQARDEARRASAIVEQTRASWLPTLTGNAVYTRLDHDRTSNINGATTITAPANSAALNALLTVPVFAPRAWLNTSVSEENAKASLATAEDTRRLVAVAVGRAYLSILAQHRILEADLRAVADAQAHRDYAAQRFQGGVGNRVDLVRAQQELALGQTLVEQARTALIRDQESLGVLLAENRPLDVQGEPTLPVPPTDPARAEQDVKERRKDLEALMVRSQAADDVVSHHWADFVPTLAVTFEPFYQTQSLAQPTSAGWQATAALVWPIYDGGLRYGLQKERKLLADEAHLAEDAALRQAHSDVRAALAEVAHADAGLIAARQAAKLAHEALDLTNIAYHAGASTNIEVIDAERVALDADTQAAVAEDQARQARLDLLAATGRFP